MIPLSLWCDKQAHAVARRRACAAVFLIATFLCAFAQAHALVVVARPAMHALVPMGDLDIRLEFNSRIDRVRSRLTLRGPDGSSAILALLPSEPDNVLAARARVARPGEWTIRWQVLSLDGHITRGDIPFAAKAP